MFGTRLMALAVTAVCLSLSAGDAAIVTTEPPLANQTNAGNCSGDRFRKERGDPLSCCQEGNRTYHIPADNRKRLIFRTYDKPCTGANGQSANCEGGESEGCVHGPCGGKREWVVDAEELHIFKPVSQPGKCGWAVRNVIACREGCDWPKGSNLSDPEPFTNQTEYPGVTATCPFNRCVRGGTPTP